jgi:hypothetical protein
MAFSIGYSLIIMAIAILVAFQYNTQSRHFDDLYFYIGASLFYAYRLLGVQGFLFGMKYLECTLKT